jgi:hypothetical protein
MPVMPENLKYPRDDKGSAPACRATKTSGEDRCFS